MLHSEDESRFIRTIGARLALVRENIARSAAKAGRRAEAVEIVTISKRQPEVYIQAAYACGLRCFGENYAEEALVKMNNLSGLPDLQWDIVGHIQSRKARLIADRVARVHSVDSLKLAGLLSQLRPADMPALDVLLEVNVSGEESKGGFPAVSQADWSALLPAAGCGSFRRHHL
ncbi:MAG TPA: YggS family pyridoxal phosphate-dependent enzyme [Anaerolineaceae bacterium]|nr:YggS family pyridoxal phosphate-dependent enzyme [Anaerolineaceae bacterium]